VVKGRLLDLAMMPSVFGLLAWAWHDLFSPSCLVAWRVFGYLLISVLFFRFFLLFAYPVSQSGYFDTFSISSLFFFRV